MARAKPLSPAGEEEARLVKAVEDAYPSTTAFYKTVAKERGSTAVTEKRAYYRIVNGNIGTQSARRIRTYAKLLSVQPREFLRSEELPREDPPARLEDLIAQLIGLLEEDLAQRQEQPGASSVRRG